MLATQIQTRTSHPALVRVLSIAVFAALTALAARLTINLPFTPVPLTLQVLVVLLAGLTLGAKDGAASQIVYGLAITAGLPLDARGLGPAVWATPSGGFLLGFIAGAFVAGYLAENGLRRNPALRLVAGLAGVEIGRASCRERV
jgi:biotin transport system substrate-specific component